MRRAAASLFLAGLLAGPARAVEAPCPSTAPAEAEEARRAARCWLEAGEPLRAVELLKAACAEHPDDGALLRELAHAYLAAGNTHWALKRLLAGVEARPEDAETRSWATWLLLESGDLPRARALLDAAPPAAGPLAARLELERAALARLEEREQEAARSLERVQGASALYPEDRALLRDLRWRVLGDPGRPWSARLLLGGGWSSNAVEGTPEDLRLSAEEGVPTASPLLLGDLLLRHEPWTGPRARPVGELRLRGQLATAEAALSHSSTTLSARAGAELGDPRELHGRVLYAFELVGLAGTDAYSPPGAPGRWYIESHRLELELDPQGPVQAFAGGGARLYRELARSRAELDGGLSFQRGLGGWNLAAIGTARAYRARHPAYSGAGATAILRGVAPLPGGAFAKLLALGVADAYPDSADYYGQDEPRRDLLAQLQLGPWSPELRGWRLGLGARYRQRWSTVEDYGYEEWQLRLELRWEGSRDPSLPPALDEPGHLPLDYGLGGGGSSGLDRVQDLLQQEDSARRGSSCVD